MQSTERANFVCEHSFGGKYGRCIATMLRMSSFFFHYGASYRKGTWWHSENVRIIFWGYRVRTETSVSVPFLSLLFFTCPGKYLEAGCLLSSPLLSSSLLFSPLQLLAALATLQKRLLVSPCASVRLSVRREQLGSHRTDFFEKLIL